MWTHTLTLTHHAQASHVTYVHHIPKSVSPEARRGEGIDTSAQQQRQGQDTNYRPNLDASLHFISLLIPPLLGWITILL
jgi:hypothetical protein